MRTQQKRSEAGGLMDLVMCKLCGTRHRLGGCPSMEKPNVGFQRDSRRSETAVRSEKAKPTAPAKASKENGQTSANIPRRTKKRGKGKAVAAKPRERVVSDHVAATKPKVGRPLASERDKTLAALEPWKAMGKSRATYFRHKRAAEKINGETP